MGTRLPEDETVADLLQLELAGSGSIPVRVVGPVETRALPSRVFAVKQRAWAPDDVGDRILHEDLTRARSVIRVTGGGAYVAPTLAEVSARAGLVPDGGVLELRACGEVWVAPDPDNAEPVTVVVHSEHWTL